MKTKNKSTKTTTGCQSVYHAIPLDTCLKRFKEEATLDITGTNKNLVEKIIAVLEIVLKTKPNFNYSDVLYQTKAFDIHSEKVRPIFDRMTEYLCSVGKLERSESLYDDDNGIMYIVHV